MAQPLAWGIYLPHQSVLDAHWAARRGLDDHVRKVRLAMVRLANERGYTLAEMFFGYDLATRLAALRELESHLNAFSDVTQAIFCYGDLDVGHLDELATRRIRVQGGVGDYARFFLFQLQGERPSKAEAVSVGGR